MTIAPDYRTNIHRDPDLACAVCSIPLTGFYVSFEDKAYCSDFRSPRTCLWTVTEPVEPRTYSEMPLVSNI